MNKNFMAYCLAMLLIISLAELWLMHAYRKDREKYFNRMVQCESYQERQINEEE